MTNRLWLEPTDSSYTPQGAGVIASVQSASVNRRLDRAGDISFVLPANDKRALDALLNEGRFRLFTEYNGTPLEIARGVIRERQYGINAGGQAVGFSALDQIDELTRYNTLLARIIDATTFGAAINNVLSLAGWTGSVTGGAADITARFDGASVLRAVSELCEHQGLHFRLSSTSQQLEVGAFGDDSGIHIFGGMPELMPAAFIAKDANIAYIDSLTLLQSSNDICNFLVPLGQGEGEAALTLANSTRVSPYTITPFSFNSRTLYRIEDAASIASYGQNQQVKVFKQIGAISNSDANLQNAANALYDAAASYLSRYSQRYDRYLCTVRGLRRELKPGQKVRLTYEGTLYTLDGEPYAPVSVDQLFWVMAVDQTYGQDQVASLELATVDRIEKDGAELVVGALEDIRINELRIQTYPSVRSFVYSRDIAPSFNADIPVLLTSTTTALNRCLVQVVSRPFRSNVTGAASGGGATSGAGGDHRHLVFKYTTDALLPNAIRRYFCRIWTGSSYNQAGVEIEGPLDDIYTHDASGDHTHTIPDHTHAMTYGIFDDAVSPDTVSIYVDGIDRTSALGGPWGVGGGAIDVTLDVTAYLQGSLRSKHTLQFRCTGGRGEMEVTVEIYETIQSISVN